MNKCLVNWLFFPLQGEALLLKPNDPTFTFVQEAPSSQDILVFLTGQEEIEAMSKTCRDIAKHLPDGCPSMLVLPLYASLPYAQQLRVFQAAPKVSAPPPLSSPSPGDARGSFSGACRYAWHQTPDKVYGAGCSGTETVAEKLQEYNT